MTDRQMIGVVLALPLAASLLAVLLQKRPNLREASSLGIGVGLFCLFSVLAARTFDGGRPAWELASFIPGDRGEAFVVAFRLEPLGALFGLVASGLWVATTCYAMGYMRSHQEPHQARFYACFAIAIFAAMGAALASNLLTLFVFYEVMTLSTYPLVTHHGTPAARHGGRIYVGLLMSTSIGLFMFAIVWTWSITGSLDFQPGGILSTAFQQGHVSATQLGVLLALFIFGTAKAAVMPFHRWLPAAMVAPTPVSALLHAVAVVKVGVFSVLKIVVYVFGTDLLSASGINVWLMYVASFTILAASIVAMTKDNLKARLAYSTISQLSYIVFGAATGNAWGIVGAGMHIVMHAVGKITLFFCAGAIYVSAHKTQISQLDGIGRRMPVTMAAFLLAALSIIGLPPFGGAWSKWWLALGAAHTQHPWLMAVLMISSLLNVAYLLPIPLRAFYRKPADSDADVREAPLCCVVPLAITAVGGVVLFVSADWIYFVLKPIVGIPS